MNSLKALLITLLLSLHGLALAEEQSLVEAMMHNADPKQVIAMIKSGAEVNAADKVGRTPLMMAVMKKLPDVAVLLLDKGADVNATAPNGANALTAAILGGHPKMVKLLLDHGAKMDNGKGDGKDALTMATIGTCPDFTTGLKGATATQAERIATFKLLLDRGADANIKLPEGYSPLLVLAESGGVAEAATLLLDYGAKVDAPNEKKITPLMAAAYSGNTEVARVLLKHGADRNLKSSAGKTALDYAREKSYEDIVKLLESK
jgi:ankyrin repeat protein